MDCCICTKLIPENLPRQTRYCSEECRKKGRKLSSKKWYTKVKDDPAYREKTRESGLKYKAKHPEKLKERSRQAYHKKYKNDPEYKAKQKILKDRLKENPDWISKKRQIDKEYYLKNKDTLKEKARKYARSNPAKVKTWTGSRKAAFKKATPNWLTSDQIAEMNYFYFLAKDLRVTTGEDYHVDHIVPLQGKTVCGLHVPWNLQVLPSDLNLSKGVRLTTLLTTSLKS